MLTRYTVNTFRPFSIGLDDFFNFAETLTSEALETKFPSYNIINVDNKNYLIEVALAGYKKEDIDIIHENGVITVSHEKKEPQQVNTRIIHNGITKKSFSKAFPVGETIVVKGASFIDGLLTISLEDITPEEKKAKKITISDTVSVPTISNK